MADPRLNHRYNDRFRIAGIALDATKLFGIAIAAATGLWGVATWKADKDSADTQTASAIATLSKSMSDLTDHSNYQFGMVNEALNDIRSRLPISHAMTQPPLVYPPPPGTGLAAGAAPFAPP